MNIKSYLAEAGVLFVLTLVVSVIVSYLYGLLVHGAGSADWELAFRNAFLFGLVIPTFRVFRKRV
ncbi:hypothetical protein ACFLZR_00165 [Candidatus Neomarinimicrobiota bacterium]